MIVGIPRETFPGDRRVAITPAVVPALKGAGHEIVMEPGAGVAAGYSDAEYERKGARPAAGRSELFAESDVILQVRGYSANPDAGAADLRLLRANQALIAFLDPLASPELVRELAERGVVAFALELMPRSTRAQGMDALTSMAAVAGYKAVLLAADALPKMFPMMMTAAGTLAPAKLFVIGAGVAGLQAIATARRLGAVVQAYDVRPAVREEVQSLGARFVEIELPAAGSQEAGGYARAMDEEFYRRQREKMTSVIAESDVVITTAAVPGRRAPILVTTAMVAGMRPGSVVVDMAAEKGGNCEVTQPGKTIVYKGVTIIGRINLAAELPYHASQMYARNVTTFLLHLTADGRLAVDGDDEIIRETMVTRGGRVVHPRLLEGTDAAAGAGRKE